MASWCSKENSYRAAIASRFVAMKIKTEKLAESQDATDQALKPWVCFRGKKIDRIELRICYNDFEISIHTEFCT